MRPDPGARLYRLLLRLYPAEFRRRYREEMVEFYRARRDAAGSGPLRIAGLWLRLVRDVIASAAAERAAALSARFRRSTRRESSMDTLMQDLRQAFRGLARAPAFAAVVLLTLGVGIGAGTAIFSVVNAVLLKPLPYPQAERTVVLWNARTSVPTYNAFSAAEYFDLTQVRAFDAVVAIREQASTIIGDGGEPERLSAYVVTPNFFDLLGTAPLLGRAFRSGDGVPGTERVIVLSHPLWVRRFGGDPAVLGRQVNIGGFVRTIVGVMPPGIGFPDAPLGFLRNHADFWIPTTMEQYRSDSRGNQYIGVIARIREGTTPAQLASELETVSGRLRTEFPDYYAGPSVRVWSYRAVGLRDQMVGSVRPALVVLSGAVALLLLIACVNVANLLLARGALRQRELAVRLALGANRQRLLRQLLTESMLLALGGGTLGVVLARLGVPLLVALDGGSIPRLQGTGLSGTVLVFSLLVSLMTGLLVGLVPALQQSGTELKGALGEGSRGASEGLARRRLRSVLVAAQVAMALVILVAAGLLGRSFAALERVDPGFKSGGVLSLKLNLPRSVYDSATKINAFFEQLTPAIAAIPGVTEASGVYPLPMGGEGWSGSFDVEGLTPGPGGAEPHAEYSVTLPGYFHAMGIPLIAGREFSGADRAGAPRVAVVDERLAAKYWPGASAIGKRINPGEATGVWTTVIGVVGHVHRSSLIQEGEPQLYVPLAQRSQTSLALVVRTGVDPAALSPALRSAVRGRDKDLPTAQLRTMDELLAGASARQRFNMLMIGVFAVVALGLASVGLYGVMSYLVSQRTREIGIRIALGGQPGDVRRMVVRESLLISISGLLTGAAISLALSRVVGGLLFGVRATDPPTYLSIGLLLLVVAGLASYGPARRATRVDPLVALRE